MDKQISLCIRISKSRIHNKGVFARKLIPKKALIIEYVGEKITKAESEKISKATLEASRKDKSKGAEYIFELDDEYDIDGNMPSNTAKYINHSCEPNCEYYYKKKSYMDKGQKTN